jgi:hypothetical protein
MCRYLLDAWSRRLVPSPIEWGITGCVVGQEMGWSGWRVESRGNPPRQETGGEGPRNDLRGVVGEEGRRIEPRWQKASLAVQARHSG